ncbi:hypothetical protein HQ531_05380 [bacterium]|nr:hypothetical protein [bacterium]
MPSRKVSEKTLEINICAEVLSWIRSRPGCASAFWVGMKQQQEANTGIDDLISNVPNGMHLVFQYKAPRPIPRDQIPYLYTINDRQNRNLVRLAINHPQSVMYVLPHYNTFVKVRTDSPYLARDTWILRVIQLRNLRMTNTQTGRHRVESYQHYALVYSNENRFTTTMLIEEVQGIFSNETNIKELLISHSVLKTWLISLKEESNNNANVIGQWLRGFSTCCIPEGN